MKMNRVNQFAYTFAVILALTFVSMLSGASAEQNGFSYVHDPRENSYAMADAIDNPDAVYRFSPNPESVRLGTFAEYDWTDPPMVEKVRQKRVAYHPLPCGIVCHKNRCKDSYQPRFAQRRV